MPWFGQEDFEKAEAKGPLCDPEYLEALEPALARLLAMQPDFVFYLAGADPFELDRLGRLGLTKEGLRRRDELVLLRCREARRPVAIVMAGGYAEQVNDIVDIHANTIRTATSFVEITSKPGD